MISPDLHRAIVKAFDDRTKSVPDIAVALGVHPQTVYSNWRRAGLQFSRRDPRHMMRSERFLPQFGDRAIGVLVDESPYKALHGNSPRGIGVWTFLINGSLECYAGMDYRWARFRAIAAAKRRRYHGTIQLRP